MKTLTTERPSEPEDETKLCLSSELKKKLERLEQKFEAWESKKTTGNAGWINAKIEGGEKKQRVSRGGGQKENRQIAQKRYRSRGK